MPEDIFYFRESEIPADIPDIPHEVFAPVREGLIAGTLVEIEYENASDEDSKRQVLPEVLFRSSDNWYLAAYCMLRDEPRTFRLDRIVSAKDTGIMEESGGVAEDFRANGIPWKRDQDKETKTADGENNASEWRKIELKPGENTPEYRIPPPDPEWQREAARRRVCNDLVEHAGKGDLERMEEDIAAGADVNYSEGSQTPLMAAARGGHVEAAKLLIRHGADPDKRGRTTCTVLNEAARCGRMDMIRYLVEELNLPLDQRDYFGWSPVFCAVQNGHADALRYFLEHGGDPDLPDKNGVTPLMEVFNGGFSDAECRVRLTKLLLEHGADVNRGDKTGRSALFHAVSRKKIDDAVGLLRDAGADFQICDKKGVSLLLHAVTAGIPMWNHDFPNSRSNDKPDTVKLVEYLLWCGANPNFPDRQGVVPVMPATGDLLKCLLSNGADPSAADNLGRTAAMYHASDREDLLLLQEYGADLHARDLCGNDVLLCGCRFPEHIRFLIETFGFSVNDRNDDGYSILHRVSDEFLVDSVKYLLAHGADPAARTKDGRTPLDIVHIRKEQDPHPSPSSDYDEIADLYEEALSGETSELIDACRDMDFKRIRAAVEKGASVHHILLNDGNRTALTIASERFADPANGISWLRFLRIFLYLSENGADKLAIDDDGNCVPDALIRRDCKGSLIRFMRYFERVLHRMDIPELNGLIYSLRRKQSSFIQANNGSRSEALAKLISAAEQSYVEKCE